MPGSIKDPRFPHASTIHCFCNWVPDKEHGLNFHICQKIHILEHQDHFQCIKVLRAICEERMTGRVGGKLFTYNKEKSSLGFPDHANALISIGIGFAGIEIDPDEKQVIGVKGLLPRSIWLKKRLKTPNAFKGILRVRTEGVDIRNKTYIQICKQEDTFYDEKTGWICIGERKVYDFDDCVEFLGGAILVLRDNKVISLWLNVGADLPLY